MQSAKVRAFEKMTVWVWLSIRWVSVDSPMTMGLSTDGETDKRMERAKVVAFEEMSVWV